MEEIQRNYIEEIQENHLEEEIQVQNKKKRQNYSKENLPFLCAKTDLFLKKGVTSLKIRQILGRKNGSIIEFDVSIIESRRFEEI